MSLIIVILQKQSTMKLKTLLFLILFMLNFFNLQASECYHYRTKIINEIKIGNGKCFWIETTLDPNGISIASYRIIPIKNITTNQLSFVSESRNGIIVANSEYYYWLDGNPSTLDEKGAGKIIKTQKVSGFIGKNTFLIDGKWTNIDYNIYSGTSSNTIIKGLSRHLVVIKHYQQGQENCYLIKDDKKLYIYNEHEKSVEDVTNLNKEPSDSIETDGSATFKNPAESSIGRNAAIHSYRRNMPLLYGDGKNIDYTLNGKNHRFNYTHFKDLKLAYAFDEKLFIEDQLINSGMDFVTVEFLGSTVDVINPCDNGRIGGLSVEVEYNYYFKDKKGIYLYHSGNKKLKKLSNKNPKEFTQANFIEKFINKNAANKTSIPHLEQKKVSNHKTTYFFIIGLFSVACLALFCLKQFKR